MKKNKIHTKDPLVSIIYNSLVRLPTPYSISFIWNIGFLLGITLTLQIVTGLVLSINYIADTEIAFNSVIHIVRDIESGWIMRFLHINGASIFFRLIYVHLSRGLYYGSPKKVPIVWLSGVVLLLGSIGAAFLGYVLPWGQISFWGATVITRILTAIPYLGNGITLWLWGNFSVSQPTLNRFLSLHFLIPLLVVALVLAHLILLHKTGSSNPLGVETNKDKIKFFPYFLVKDINPILSLAIGLLALISVSPNLLGDAENYTLARPEVTPTHIQPEWYFLFAYAILRSIPSKLGGVVAILASILILITPIFKKSSINKKFSPSNRIFFWMFIVTRALLTWIGANPVEEPFIIIGQLLTCSYFILIIVC